MRLCKSWQIKYDNDLQFSFRKKQLTQRKKYLLYVFSDFRAFFGQNHGYLKLSPGFFGIIKLLGL